METLGDGSFSLVSDYEHLLQAYMDARKGKQYRREVARFSEYADLYLLEIEERLKNETYEFGPYRRLWVYIPKRRMVMALPFPDRVVQWSIYNLINPYFDRRMIEDSYACREGKGSTAAALRLQNWLRKAKRRPGRWYILKLDISKYFYRVDHAVLLEILGRHIKDAKLMRLLDRIINSTDEPFGLPRGMGPDDVTDDEWIFDVGMPIGNLTSQLFANIYLNELDQFAKHELKIDEYIRYMDDVIALAPDKETARENWIQIERFLKEKLHLELNRKTAIIPVEKGVEFVGIQITAQRMHLRKSTVGRMKRETRFLTKEVLDGNISREKYQRHMTSIYGLTAHVDNKNLKARLDAITAPAMEGQTDGQMKDETSQKAKE